MMNERIKELMAQAEEVVFSAPSSGRTTKQLNLEKFAELIVRDCISQIAMIGVSNFENEDIMWTVELAILNIENRFGIKND